MKKSDTILEKGLFATQKNAVSDYKANEPIIPYNEIAISDSLREKLLRFFMDGNPIDLIERDEFFNDSARLVVKSQSASISALRNQFSIGNNRSAYILDQLASVGIVGPRAGNFNRQVLIPDEIALEQILIGLPPIEKLEDGVIESFYEKNKDEIELYKIEYERNKLRKLKKTGEGAINVQTLEMKLTGNFPKQEYKELIETD
jgi:hypothetical protein